MAEKVLINGVEFNSTGTTKNGEINLTSEDGGAGIQRYDNPDQPVEVKVEDDKLVYEAADTGPKRKGK